jgi:DNA replication protein DnaC
MLDTGSAIMQGAAEAIRVAVRIRPEEAKKSELDTSGSCLQHGAGRLTVLVPPEHRRDDHAQAHTAQSTTQAHNFAFDSILGFESSQSQVFHLVKPLLTDVLSGFNSSIVAYGCSGSGKTHTISGLCFEVRTRLLDNVF